MKKINDFETTTVPESERESFVAIFLVLVAFQVSAIMFFLGAITISHLSLWDAFLVVATSTSIIAIVAGITGAVGAHTGLSLASLCEHCFGRIGSKLQQIFQGVIELGWFVVIVALTGSAAQKLLGISGGTFGAFVLTFILGVLFIPSVIYGFRGMKYLSYASLPFVFLILFGVFQHLFTSQSALWVPGSTGPGFLKTVTIATGTFITGATLTPDITRFAKSFKSGGIAGISSFYISIPFSLFLGAIVAMQAGGNPDFVAAISEWTFPFLALLFLILSNWSTGDTTLYMSVVPLVKLLNIPRHILIIIIGTLGAILASIGIENFIQNWLLALGIILPPLAGLVFGLGIKLYFSKEQLKEPQKIKIGGLGAWGIGILTAFLANQFNLGLAPVVGILFSMFSYLIFEWISSSLKSAWF